MQNPKEKLVNKSLELLSPDELGLLPGSSWGSYTKDSGWSDVVFSGRVIREWIQKLVNSLITKVTNLENSFSGISNQVSNSINLMQELIEGTISNFQEEVASSLETFLEGINESIEILQNTSIANISPNLSEGQSLTQISGQASTSSISNIEYNILDSGGNVLGTFKSAALVFTKAPDYFRLIIKGSNELNITASNILVISGNIIHSKSFSVSLTPTDLHCYIILLGMNISSVTGPLGASFTSLFIKINTITKDGKSYNIFHYGTDVGINLTLTINIV